MVGAVCLGASGTSFAAVVAAGCSVAVRVIASGILGHTWVAPAGLAGTVLVFRNGNNLAADLAAAALDNSCLTVTWNCR